MGGSNETILDGPDKLRMHESCGRVHIHDDKRNIKFDMKMKKFKSEYSASRAGLLTAGNTGFIAKIEDHNGVALMGEIDRDQIDWSLDAQIVQPTGLDAIDSFLINY